MIASVRVQFQRQFDQDMVEVGQPVLCPDAAEEPDAPVLSDIRNRRAEVGQFGSSRLDGVWGVFDQVLPVRGLGRVGPCWGSCLLQHALKFFGSLGENQRSRELSHRPSSLRTTAAP